MARRNRVARATKRFYRKIRKLGKKRGLLAPKKQLKTYNYTFNLAPQAINSSVTTVGQVAVNNNSPVVPINPSTGFNVRSGTLNFSSALVDWAAATTHRLSDIVNVNTFTGMYDAYKINKVTATIQYLSNTATVNGSGLMPTFYMYWDQDDSVVPTSAGQILGKAGVRKWQPTSSNLQKSFSYVPLLANTVESDGGSAAAIFATNAVVPNKAQWVDCTSPRVPHYALKLYCQDWLATGQENIFNVVRISYKYNVSFRSPLICS